MHAFYEKLTDRARGALDEANYYAKKNKHPLVTPLHVLYGILHEGKNVAAVVLKNLGVDTNELKKNVVEGLGSGKYESNDIAVPYSREVCRLMCVAIEFGLEVQFIACQHLLKAMLTDDDDLAYVLLSKRGVSLELVDTEIKSCVKKVDPVKP